MNVKESIYQTLCVREVKEEVNGFKTIMFEDGHGIRYQAGQYLTLVRFEGLTETRRSYSITSSPDLQEPLSIGVKRVENGAFSRFLVDVIQPGDSIKTTGAGGFFLLPDEADAVQQLFFFAAGSGITPAFSLIKTALYSRPALSIVLVYSNASPAKAIFLPQLQSLQEQFGARFKLEPLFSNNADLYRARLHRDLIFSFRQQYVDAAEKKTLYYICGPENYMRLCTATLLESGVPAATIRKENFQVGSEAKRDTTSPDKNTYTVIIRTLGKEFSFPVPFTKSILKAAKEYGHSLPYSCEAGRCGNCVAKCVDGAVWHSYNEVLTQKELNLGLVLTCVGHPVNGNVILEI
jgi:ring-1,2-phenylacetyl-CoA epoxidase subunit PaaE